MNNIIRNDDKWFDTDRNIISAHCPTVFYDENVKKYVWIGQNTENTLLGGSVWHSGVRMYFSKDLCNWESKGIVVPASDDEYSPLHSARSLDRVKIIYSEKTDKYVMWIHILGQTIIEDQYIVIMQSDDLEGPYEMVNKHYYPNGIGIGDFTFHKDSKTGKNFVVFNRPHFELGVFELTEDCLDVKPETYSAHITGTHPPFTAEAPTITEYANKKYLFTSGTTGYFPNRTTVYVFDDFNGNFECLGDPCIDDVDGTTFNSQISSIICVNNKYFAIADRWIPDFYGKENALNVYNNFVNEFKEYSPNLSKFKPYKLSKVNLDMPVQTRDSSYVWLPIDFVNGVPKIYWRDEFSV